MMLFGFLCHVPVDKTIVLVPLKVKWSRVYLVVRVRLVFLLILPFFISLWSSTWRTASPNWWQEEFPHFSLQVSYLCAHVLKRQLDACSQLYSA